MIIEAGSGKEGLKSVIDELHDPSLPVPGTDGEQLRLPDLPLAGKDPESRALEERRGRGRPLGAKNKNTEAWRDYILTQYRSPLEALAQTFNMSIPDLAKRLGLVNPPTFEQALELLKVQIAAARDLAPFIHQKMPLALENAGGGLIQLVMNMGTANAQAGPDAANQAITILNTPPEQNQLVTLEDFNNANETNPNETGASV